MANSEQLHDTSVLLDIDGTTSNTSAHMTDLSSRLVEDFPEVREALPRARAERKAFRQQHRHLSHAQQDTVWQQSYPGTSFHSQLDIYRTFAPDVFTEQKTAEIYEWLSEPANFGYAEYDDVEPMMAGLQEIGALAVLFTLGQTKTLEDHPGWQELKVAASPRFSQMRSHITATLPEGGKGQVINESYDQQRDLFRFPMTDHLGDIATKGLIMVDDSRHNLQIAQPAMGILIDRQGKSLDWEHSSNIHVVQSLEQVPALVEANAAGRNTH
jgi:hypothetical protein